MSHKRKMTNEEVLRALRDNLPSPPKKKIKKGPQDVLARQALRKLAGRRAEERRWANRSGPVTSRQLSEDEMRERGIR